MDPLDQKKVIVGATVSVVATKKQCKVIKRQGMRIRVAFDDSTEKWFELKDLLLVKGEKADADVSSALFDRIDADSSGEVDRGEFLSFFLPLASNHSQVLNWWSSLVSSAPLEKKTVLPSGWASHFDEEGNEYYFNEELNETAWELPEGEVIEGLDATQGTTNFERRSQSGRWSVHLDEEGNEYYFNEKLNETAWELPEGEVIEGLDATQGTTNFERRSQSGRWSVHLDEEGNEYYFNEELNETAWELPEGEVIKGLGGRSLALDISKQMFLDWAKKDKAASDEMQRMYQERRPLWALTSSQQSAKDFMNADDTVKNGNVSRRASMTKSKAKKAFATVNTSLATVATSYSPDEHLLVVAGDGSIIDVHVIEGTQAHHELCAFDASRESFKLDLNFFNHSLQRFPSVAAYLAAINAFCAHLESSTAELEDAITGIKLRTKDQLLALGLRDSEIQWAEHTVSVKKAPKIAALCEPLCVPRPQTGNFTSQPVLVCADPGTGKTWSAIQLTNELAKKCQGAKPEGGVPLVPVLVYVQRISRMLEGRDQAKDLDASLLFHYFALEQETTFADHPEWLSAITMAFEMRSLIVVLDGIDEAAGRKETISRLIREILVPSGVRVICTSRPEGVNAQDFHEEGFTLFDLKKLDDEQQQRAVQSQLVDNPVGQQFSKHLLRFSEIRVEHDRLYVEEAFNSEEERKEVEGFSAPNLLVREDGRRDPQMRQKTDKGVWAAVSSSPQPTSIYLKKLNEVITTSLLEDLDQFLEKGNPTEEDIEICIKESLGLKDKATASVVSRLALLLLKRKKTFSESPPEGSNKLRAFEYLKSAAPQTTAIELWPCIVARTSEIYASVEGFLPLFKDAIKKLASEIGLTEADIELAPTLKDPVRVHEKALDDYVFDFDDWDDSKVIPETAVIDMIRGRVLCSDSKKMLSLLEKLSSGVELEIDDAGNSAPKRVRLSLVRVKNKFVGGGPTHFRNILTNLTLECNGLSVFTELQIHHREILKYNDESGAHDAYEYFRSLLSSSMDKDLDEMLERTIVFLEEIKGVPVLLSMLVLIFNSSESVGLQGLPADRFELYEMAINLSIQRQVLQGSSPVAQNILRKIAVANHKSRRREFTSKDVDDALAGSEKEAEFWRSLVASEDGPPLIKTLVDAGGGKEGLYQFRHLSFQEGLYVQAIAQGAASWVISPFDLEDGWFRNAFSIGGARLMDAVQFADTAEELSFATKGASIMGELSWQPLGKLCQLKALRLDAGEGNGGGNDSVRGLTRLLADVDAAPSLVSIELSLSSTSYDQEDLLEFSERVLSRKIKLLVNDKDKRSFSSGILTAASICSHPGFEPLRAAVEEAAGEDFWTRAYLPLGRSKAVYIMHPDGHSIPLRDLLVGETENASKLRELGFGSQLLFRAGFPATELNEAWNDLRGGLPVVCDECGSTDTTVGNLILVDGEIKKEFLINDVVEMKLSCLVCKRTNPVSVKLVSNSMIEAISNAKGGGSNGPAFTDNELRAAVKEWFAYKNREKAKEKYGPIENWNVSAVTDMSDLFKNRDKFISDISSWDVANVTNMSGMFDGASSFNCNISSWAVGNVKNMEKMLDGARTFNLKSLLLWPHKPTEWSDDIENAAISEMSEADAAVISKYDFEKLSEAIKVKLLKKFRNICGFNNLEWTFTFLRVDVNSAISQMSEADAAEILKEEFEKLEGEAQGKLVGKFGRLWGKDFKFGNKSLKAAAKEYCTDAQTAETKYGPISGWDVSEVTDMVCLFCADGSGVGEAGKQFNADLSRWDVSNVTDMGAMFYEAKQFNCNLSSWNVEKVTKMQSMFAGAKKFDKNTIKDWEEERKKAVRAADSRGRKFGNEDLKAAAKEWCEDEQTAEAKYGTISGWDVSRVTSMNCLFSADSDDTGEAGKQFNADLSRWDVSNVTDMYGMFYGAEQFNCNLSSWNVEKVTNMQSMFWGAKKFDKNTIKGWELK
eukprot:CAMPEP_0182519176 /NCGR_PEP_ID=MMETSP1321-20130603/44958_1 /TAXON_ID=91990 /ORGANISM="Bolidomonas sp., Strain RCC1657" /LENGTH=1957 /DNA_ID=CAMNT_0024727141 /DNA_START=127 /DNA_END=5997 /DNA_ORIENTATION=-